MLDEEIMCEDDQTLVYETPELYLAIVTYSTIPSFRYKTVHLALSWVLIVGNLAK